MIWITEKVQATAQAMGGSDLNAEVLELFVSDLRSYPDHAIATGLARCRREIKSKNGFPPRLVIGDVLERMGVVNGEDAELAATTAAWEFVIHVAKRFVRVDSSGLVSIRRWVGKPAEDCQRCSGTGMYLHEDPGTRHREAGKCNCMPIEEPPAISDRIQAVVDLMGGWSKFRDIAEASFPFVKKEFAEEFRRWKKVEIYRARIPLGESIPRGGPMTRLSAPRELAALK